MSWFILLIDVREHIAVIDFNDWVLNGLYIMYVVYWAYCLYFQNKLLLYCNQAYPVLEIESLVS